MGKALAFLSVLTIASCFLVSAAQQAECLDENPPYDIVFLLDSSSSLSTVDFEDVKRFVRNFIDGLDIDTKKVQVGLARFSTQTQKEFLLGRYANKAELIRKIDNMQYRTGGTYLGKAMNFLKDNYFTSAGGSRIDEKVPQIVVVMTDGDSSDDITGPASDLRQKGIIIFAIAVSATNMTGLKAIANRPPERFVFNIANYQALQGVTNTIKKTVCILMREQGKAIAPKFADVFLLVDSSARAKTNEIRELLTELALNLNVGDGSHKIALAQFGETVVQEFLFNDYQTTSNAIAYIDQFDPRPNGDRNVGKAIDFVRTRFLNTASGSRIAEGYKQYLLVLRTGNSADNAVGALRKMKNEHVTVLDIRLEANLRYLSPTTHVFQFNQNIVDFASEISKRILPIETLNVTEDCTSAQVADIVFIVDESGSITTSDFEMMRRFLHRTISGLIVNSDSVRVGMILYNDKPRADFYLDSFDNKTVLLNYIKLITHNGGGTKTGAALKFAKDKLFTTEKGSRKALGVKQIAIVITDGESQDDVTARAAELRRSGVTVYAVGVRNASMEELKKIASYPDKQFVFNASDFEKLRSLDKSLRKSICRDVIDRSIDKNDKLLLKQGCVNTDEADIYFLLDHSSGFYADFEDVKKFILGFLEFFNIGPNRVRVGVAKVNSEPTLQFSLRQNKDKASLKAAVKTIIQPSGGTKTGRALTYMAKLFNQAKVSRSAEVQQILIVITDKKSQDDVSVPAEELRIQGVSVYAIGIRNAGQDELFKMTADENKKFYGTNYDALTTIKREIARDICSQDACKNNVADVMFLIDGSTSIHENDFASMKTFINKVANGTFIGEENVHIGVVQFSNDPQEEFPLNRFYDNDDVKGEIDGIGQLTGDTYTGKALSFISKYFDANNGGRPEVPQFLIVITDGEAHDPVAKPAKAIRDKGVTILSIGVGININTTQLWEISGTRDKVYMEDDFKALQSIEKKLQFKICNPETDCPNTQVADVIFLVQCTRQIRFQDFENIKNFLISVVNDTQIGDNLVQVGVIVYSDTPNQFSLLQHKNKRQVLEAISTLKSPTGKDNTVKALEYSLAYFNNANGGRHERGIPQVLFLITDGDAGDQENLRVQAEQFEAKRIIVYGIGVARAQDSQLAVITKNKNKVFHVNNYEGLQSVQKNISGVICNVTKPECQNKVADLVFLIDGSESITEESWEIMITFLIDVVNKLRVGPTLFRIGIAQFSRPYRKEFYLNEYENATEVISAIKKINQLNDGTLIGNALGNVVEFFDESKGSRIRNNIPQNLVLITDGKSDDDVKGPADILRQLKVNIFVIGIGKYSLPQVKYIAGSDDRLFQVKNFNNLNLATATFVDAICIPTPVPYDSKTCTVDIGIGFDNSLIGSSSPSIFRDQKRLQLFLPEIIRHISVVHNVCCITQPTLSTKVGFLLVDANGNKLNDFNFEEYSDGVLEKVMAFQTSQSLKFNTNLLRSFEEKFRASNSYVKVLIIFTDGLDESVEDLLLAVNSLKTSGVKALLTVALDGSKSTLNLHRLEFGRGMHYKQLLSIGMENVASVMQKEIDTVVSRECCNVLCKCTGHEGPRGNQGPRGFKGSPGLDGLPGYPGEEGMHGERGPVGLNGTRGHQGCSGRRGVKGGRGYRGENGDVGEDGLNGVNGEQGEPGAAGHAGDRGDPGSPGPRGISGSPGNPGQRGLRGDPGSPGLNNNNRGRKGDIGSPGLQGDPGADGFPGQIGDNGRPGPNGRRGSAGALGPRGPPGEPGQQGLPGASGPLGPSGPPGVVGQKGFLGLPGPQGSPGFPGRPGTKGSLGSRGQKGQQGDPGVKGASGPLGPRGLPGKDGADGYGFAGPKGQKGDSGFPGYPGLQGEPGFKGVNGGGGPKGTRGRGGDAGRGGGRGDPGSDGMPGHRGQKGKRGERPMSDCQLISYVRENCVCCKNAVKCPAFPTDLVIGMDMSEDVTPQAFERMRSIVLKLLDNINIAESSCPTGARVAVVSFSSYTKYLIRFNDYHRKKELINAVNNIALERTSNQRNLGAAMRFVGRNVLKRVRKGVLMRKVAIFLSAGDSRDSTSLTTAILEHKALDIKLGVIALRNVPVISRVFEADETQSFILTVLGRLSEQNTTLTKIQSCVICFDPCRPSSECVGTNLAPGPQVLDIDLAVIVDDSRSILADEYEGVKEVLGSVLDQIVVSSRPSVADRQARVALYQQSSVYSAAQSNAKETFGFQSYSDRDQMKRSIYQDLKQTGGSTRLAFAMEYVVMQGILAAPKGRKNKMVLAIIGEETASQDREKLDFISKVAKCEGVVLFTLMVGEHISSSQVEELSSYPLEQHIIHLGHLKHGEQEYTRRFMRTFFHILSKNVNSYPHPSLKRQCTNFQQEPDRRLDYEAAERPVYSVLVPSAGFQNVAVEEEMEEEYTAQKKTEDQQTSGRVDSIVKSPTDRTDSPCHLNSDSGTVCGEYVQQWYYKEAVGSCLPFWYGGCDGNSNRFSSEKECLQTCGKQNPEPDLQAKEETALFDDACLMKQDVGPCSNYVLSWHYDIQQNECVHFWFGGCGGNKNRFDTQEACEELCLRHI